MYSTTEEYRDVFRKITNMDLSKYIDDVRPETDDLETLDEYNYDEDAVSAYLESVFNKTKHSPLFQQVYLDAAAKMISLDPEIGLSVLYSYDYLRLFYPCLEDFLNYPEKFDFSNSNYLALKKALEYRR
jgi:hypothetical protein